MWQALFRHVLEHGGGDDQVIIPPRRRQLVLKFQHVGLLVTDQGNSSRIQLRLESIEHGGGEIKCVYGWCGNILWTKNMQKGEGHPGETHPTNQNPKLWAQEGRAPQQSPHWSPGAEQAE